MGVAAGSDTSTSTGTAGLVLVLVLLTRTVLSDTLPNLCHNADLNVPLLITSVDGTTSIMSLPGTDAATMLEVPMAQVESPLP